VRKVLFLALSVTFCLFVYEISPGRLNGFAPNSQGRRVWSVARTSLNVKVRGQRSRSPGTNNMLCTPVIPAAMEWKVLAADNAMHNRRCHSVAAGGDFGGLRAVYVWQTSLALVII